MSDLEKYRSNRLEQAKKKLADAAPEAAESIIELASGAKTESVKLQASRAILEQNEVYRKEEAEARASEMDEYIDGQIVFLLKELMRKEVFLKMMNELGEGADPDRIIALREQTDGIFGISGEVIEGGTVEDFEDGED